MRSTAKEAGKVGLLCLVPHRKHYCALARHIGITWYRRLSRSVNARVIRSIFNYRDRKAVCDARCIKILPTGSRIGAITRRLISRIPAIGRA